MHAPRLSALAIVSLSVGLAIGSSAQAASLTEVSRSTWAGSVTLPTYVQMYIYVPDKLAANPPIVVSAHSCGNSATGQMGNIPITRATADKNGFILILPDNPGQNCWDVGSKASLSHDGGGDTQAVAQMVKYALSKYGGDASRVYIFGGSSGAMMTQAMLAVYPELFKAGSARAGVPAGCWAEGYTSSNQWSGSCAGGTVSKTAQAWGNLVRAMDPGYAGPRPRVQLFHGDADTTISYNNLGEGIKEWTDVLGLATNPTSSDTGYKAAGATYNRRFWSNECGYTVLQAWSSPGGTHSMAYEEAEILKFFGLDVAGGADPEPACPADGGAGGSVGAGGATSGAGGAIAGAGGRAGGAGGSGGEHGGGGNADASATGGTSASGGIASAGGAFARGGDNSAGGSTVGSGSGGGAMAGGTSGTAVTGSGGSSTTGGTSAAVVSSGGTRSGSGGSSSTATSSTSGCALAAKAADQRAISPFAMAALVGLALLRRRLRRSR